MIEGFSNMSFENIDETYSFRLSTDESIYSDTGSVSSTYKNRIDSLFRDQRSKSKPSVRSLVTTVQVHSPATSVVGSRSGSDVKFGQNDRSNARSPSPEGKNVTSIRVSSPQAWKEKVPSAREELENMFGGRDQRHQAFMSTRSAVQAKIERLFADASAEPPNIAAVRSIAPKLTLPLAPQIALPPPPPPLPKNPPPPIPNVFPTSLPLPKMLSPPQPKVSPMFPPNDSSPSPSVTPSDHQSVSSACSSPTPSQRVEVSPKRPAASMKYGVDYLGAIQLSEKATSLEVLQEPLKELYYQYRNNIYRGRRPIPGALHITEKGIRIIHGTRDMPIHIDHINPFPTIAVWAAVKLVIRREVGEHGQMFFSYAFLPLICDPEAQDKYNLYHELNVGNPNVMAGDHPPMFACVMRKVGVPKTLECHGFVCRSAEDAIVMAANLYQSLLENMRGSSSSDSSSDARDDERQIMSDSEVVPVRPPRRRRSRDSSLSDSRRLKRSSSEDLLNSRIKDENRISKRKIKRSISDRNSICSLGDYEGYTKIPLPRSKSFVNVTNKYDFQDLLDEVKEQTGLNSVDDVLKHIINPKGMSFSEMDPKYRELLLKLALTLSKDEIYKRSKNIMRKQKYRTTSIASIIDSDSEGSTITSVLRATKRSFSRLGSRASSLQTTNLKDKINIKKGLNQKGKTEILTKISEAKPLKDQELSIKENFPLKKLVPKTPLPKRCSGRSSEGYVSCSECGYESECSSKCYCSLPRPMNQPRRPTLPSSRGLQKSKSQGHMDCTCECDTESCAESEKCYCSLKKIRKNGIKMYEINLDSETNTDTDATVKSEIIVGRSSGSDSGMSHRHRTNSSPYLTEQSKSRSAGTVFSVHPGVIRNKSYSTSFSSDSDNSDKYTSRSSSKSRMPSIRQRSASTEFLAENPKRHQRHPSGSVGSSGSQDSQDSATDCTSSRRSSVDSILDTGTHRSKCSNSSQQKILLVSAVDPSGKVVYRGASQKATNEGSDNNSILSMKKTAEIAALFTELKLNQTTDLINQIQQAQSDSEDDAYSSLQANNSFLFSNKIENSLGYLP